MSSLNDYIKFALDIEDYSIVLKIIFTKFSMVLNIKYMKLSSLSQPVLFVAKLVWFIMDTLRYTYAISLPMSVLLS